MKYRFLDDLTSDIVFEAYGCDLKELFENAALALFDVISQRESVSPLVQKSVELTGEGEKDLLFNWLQELISMVDTEELFFSEFDIQEICSTSLMAVCRGEEISPGKSGTLVKAITYHRFNLEKTKKGYKATVSMDI